MSNIFDLPTSSASLAGNDKVLREDFKRVSPQRALVNGVPDGDVSFKFDLPSGKWWCPNRSYIHMEVELTKADGSVIADATNVVPTMGFASTMWQRQAMRLADIDLCSLDKNGPMVDALKTRMSMSRGWLQTQGESNLYQGDKLARYNKVKDSGKKFDIQWKPTLPIFDIAHALPGGKYELVLTAHPEQVWKNLCLESLNGVAGVVQADVIIKIKNIHFFPHVVDGPRVDNKKYLIDLDEVQCIAKTIDGETSITAADFVVKPSTYALSVAYQNSNAETKTEYPVTQFVHETGDEKDEVKRQIGDETKLKRLYIEYAGQQKPQPDATPSFIVNDSDLTMRRYYETMSAIGATKDMGGSETLQEWRRRGAYYHFQWPRDAKDASTHCVVNSEFASKVDDLRILLFHHYRRVVQVTIEDGRVVEVRVDDV
jgi:hypothetical protein